MNADAQMFKRKVINNMQQVSKLMKEILELNDELVSKHDMLDARHFFNKYLPCGGEGYPFDLSFDEQINAIDNWIELIRGR